MRTTANSKSGGKVGKAKKAATSTKKSKKESEESPFKKLFIDELKDIYWAEKHLSKALPKMAKKASSEELVDAIQSHLEETMNQIQRLEEVFEMIGEKAVAKKCEAMAGLVKEAEELMKDNEEGVVRDAAIIAAAQKVEHYEMATYGTLRTFAQMMDLQEASDLLQATLDEEGNADKKLTDIAESFVNEEAMQE